MNMDNRLVPLSDSEQTIERGDDDIRGMRVLDSAGEDIGEVDDLLIDTDENRVRYLVVASGGFLGLGEQQSFIPVDAITGIGDDEVRIGQSRELLVDAPAYDPELVNDHPYSEQVTQFWGFAPFWTPGYVYPPYPYYRD